MDRGHTVFTVNGQISSLAVKIRSVRRTDDGPINRTIVCTSPPIFRNGPRSHGLNGQRANISSRGQNSLCSAYRRWSDKSDHRLHAHHVFFSALVRWKRKEKATSFFLFCRFIAHIKIKKLQRQSRFFLTFRSSVCFEV